MRCFVQAIDNCLAETYHTDDGDRVIPGNQNELIDGCFSIQVLTICFCLLAQVADTSGILARAKPASDCFQEPYV